MTRTAGRPRDADIDRAVADAALEILAAEGYVALTYDKVARRAGASRPALYRRASSKASLVVNALVERYGLTPVPDTGSIASDLLALQEAQVALYSDPAFGAALPGIMADVRTDDTARSTWVDGFVEPRRDGVRTAVARAVARGELAADTDADAVCELLTGPIVSAAFLRGPRALPPGLAADLVAVVQARHGTSDHRG